MTPFRWIGLLLALICLMIVLRNRRSAAVLIGGLGLLGAYDTLGFLRLARGASRYAKGVTAGKRFDL